LKSWLEVRPGIEIVARDRANEYSCVDGEAAPQALHVADRFHLAQNIGSTAQSWLERRKGKVFKTLLESAPERRSSPYHQHLPLDPGRIAPDLNTRKISVGNDSSSTAKCMN
jgi:transposase